MTVISQREIEHQIHQIYVFKVPFVRCPFFFFFFQWNDVISAFRQGVPRGKHRRYMRTAEDCFVGSSAVDWLLDHVKKRKDFGPDVTR